MEKHKCDFWYKPEEKRTYCIICQKEKYEDKPTLTEWLEKKNGVDYDNSVDIVDLLAKIHAGEFHGL